MTFSMLTHRIFINWVLFLCHQLQAQQVRLHASCSLSDLVIYFPPLQKRKEEGSLRAWLEKCLDPSLEASVLFLDTCGCAKEGYDSANMVVNIRENGIVVMLLHAIMNVSSLLFCI